jgi:hypothetical protein
MVNSSATAQKTYIWLVMFETWVRMIDPELPINLLIGKGPL